jgi:hypothetical protein
MKKLLITVFLLFTTFTILHSQNYTISGIVKDSISKETLIGANIKINAATQIQTNRYGFFTFKTTNTTTELSISYIGYETLKKNITVRQDTSFTVELIPQSTELLEVKIKSDNDQSFLSNVPGSLKLPTVYVKNMPALLGENDILKTLQTMPGVQGGAEGTVNLNVRGGSSDQNAILLDGVPLYNVNHLFGFISVFNTDVLANIDFYKGYMPSNFSGRVSSVLDVSIREGNNKSIKKELNISPISSKFSIEGPIIKDKASFLFSGRRTWIDALIGGVSRFSNSNNLPSYGFYDLNSKINYNINEKQKIFLAYYGGRDSFKNTTNDGISKTSYKFNWGNESLSLRYVNMLNKNTFLNSILYFTKYQFKVINEINNENQQFSNVVSSNIFDLGMKIEVDKSFRKNLQSKYGLHLVNHSFNPNIQQFSGANVVTNETRSSIQKVIEGAFFIENNFHLSKKVGLNLGINQSIYYVNKTYYNPEPRLAINLNLDSASSIKFSYNYLSQYLHLLTNSTLNLPTDLWVPITDKIPPIRSNNFSIGYYYTLESYQFVLESYYRKMKNLIDYQEGTSFLNDLSSKWYDKVTIGQGDSYGLEFFLRKTEGNSSGWISYTLSKTNRKFEEINKGATFPFRYDRRHNLNIVLIQKINLRNQLSANFSFNSGATLTIPVGKYSGAQIPISQSDKTVNENLNYFFNELSFVPNRNNFRMPDYHRLDFSYKNSKSKNKGIRTWVFSIYNVYNKKNTFYVFFDKGKLRQMTLFPIIPSISYEYRFK